MDEKKSNIGKSFLHTSYAFPRAETYTYGGNLKQIIPLILLLSLLGCQQTPPSPALGEGTGERETPTAENTPAPTLIPTLIPTPTEVPLEALPVDEIVQKYLAGEIDDIGFLSLEQQNAFREVLAEQLGVSQRVRVVYNNEAYIDPETFIMRQLNDGRSEAEQQINPIRKVEVDSEGYLWVVQADGTMVKIEGSVGVDWNQIITDYETTDIEFSKTPAGKSGLPADQWWLTLGGTAYKRLVLANEMVGNFFFREFNASRGSLVETLPFHMIVTDKQGNPLYARLVLVSIAGKLEYFKEGSDFWTATRVTEFSRAFKEELQGGKIYYLGITIDQESIVDHPNPNAGWSVVVDENESGQVLLGERDSQDQLLVIWVQLSNCEQKCSKID
jgi:hypothetical protein